MQHAIYIYIYFLQSKAAQEEEEEKQVKKEEEEEEVEVPERSKVILFVWPRLLYNFQYLQQSSPAPGQSDGDPTTGVPSTDIIGEGHVLVDTRFGLKGKSATWVTLIVYPVMIASLCGNLFCLMKWLCCDRRRLKRLRRAAAAAAADP